MSDAVDSQLIYAPQTHIINTSFQKQQPASKLVNRYLSTAAQYLNRTKSFHVPSPNNNNTTKTQSISSQNVLTDNLVQSLHNINPSTTTFKVTLPMSTMEMNSSTTLPLNYNNQNSIHDNKPQGFVNTLRRSLRKNKERFYNKRATTMKSCHALNTYEQIIDEQQDSHPKISMTPTLLGRRQHPINKISTYSIRQTIKDSMRKKIDFGHPCQL